LIREINMRITFAAAAASALAGFLAISGPVLAQEKTEKACQDEWRANRAANKAAGVTEKDYVVKCRAGGVAATPNQTQSTAATPAEKPSAAKAPAPPAAAKPGPAAATASASANQFSTEALAKTHCTRDIVVWANLDSKIYHFSGNRDYGNTKEGAYMCEKDAMGQGIRAAKNEKHP
jgi:hypothetical protein